MHFLFRVEKPKPFSKIFYSETHFKFSFPIFLKFFFFRPFSHLRFFTYLYACSCCIPSQINLLLLLLLPP